MKRKLLCIFFMIAGAACIAAIIILFDRISIQADASPAYTLIFLSTVTIAAAVWVFGNEMRGAAFKWVFRAFSILVVLAGAVLILITSFKANAALMPIFFYFAISIAAVTAAAWRDEEEPDELKLSTPGTIFLWIFRAISIVAILACLAFIVIMWLLTDNYYDGWLNNSGINNVFSLMALASAGIAFAALSLKLRAPISGRGKGRAARCVPITAALVIIALLGFVYINCMPKYSLKDGLNIILSNPEHAQTDVASYQITSRGSYVFAIMSENHEAIIPYETFGGNPFYKPLFEYDCNSYRCNADGLQVETGYILFNPATGAYEYTHTQERDSTYSPGDWLGLKGDLIHDGHDAVLSLHFGERLLPGEAPFNQLFPVGRGELDVKLQEVMYPHNFPEADARFYLKSIGEETLKTKLSEQISGLDPRFKDKIIEVYFFGIDIATYQSGEIALKI